MTVEEAIDLLRVLAPYLFMAVVGTVVVVQSRRIDGHKDPANLRGLSPWAQQQVNWERQLTAIESQITELKRHNEVMEKLLAALVGRDAKR